MDREEIKEKYGKAEARADKAVRGLGWKFQRLAESKYTLLVISAVIVGIIALVVLV